MTTILINDFIIVLLIFLRIAAAMFAAPVLGNKALPFLVKIFLSIFIAYLVFLVINTSQITIELNMWFLVLNAFKEILTGLIFGFMLNFIFYGILFAGTLMGFDIGITIAEMFNPAEGISGNPIGELLFFMTLLLYLLINGHHYLIQSISYSFKIIPIGKFTFVQSAYDLLIKYSASVFIIALKIASPIMVSFFLIHIAEGIIARVIPQMQIFFVTQPLKIALGLFMLASLAPFYVYIIKNLLYKYEDQLFNMIKAMS